MTQTDPDIVDTANRSRRARMPKWCIWSGPAFTLLFAIGFWAVARMVPPPAPSFTAQQVADIFASNRFRIRLGLMISMASSTLFFPFVAVMSSYLRRIEGQYSPMAYVQLAGGTASICVFIFPLMSLQAANFRADRDPEVVLALSDIGWIPFVGLFGPPFMQCVAIAVAVLQDKRSIPIWPRWVGYFNIWIAILYLPGLLLVFFKSGPLAWNGLVCWWLPAAAFFSWILVMAWVMLSSPDAVTRKVSASPKNEVATS